MGSAIAGLHTHSTMVWKKNKTREVVTETRMVLWKPRHPRQCWKSRGLVKNQEAKQRSMNHYWDGKRGDPRISQWLVAISPFWWNIFEWFQASKVLAGENISPRRFSDMAWGSVFLQRVQHNSSSFLGAMYQNEDEWGNLMVFSPPKFLKCKGNLWRISYNPKIGGEIH